MRNALRYVAVRWRITDQPVLCVEKMPGASRSSSRKGGMDDDRFKM